MSTPQARGAGSRSEAPDVGVFLFTRPADARQLRWAVTAIGAVLLLAAAIVPFAHRMLARHGFFVVVYDAAIAVTNLTIAALLAGHYLIQRAAPLLLLVAAYVFAAAMAMLHAVSFPGPTGPVSWWEGGPQTTAWLYFAWYDGAALLVIGYALSGRRMVLPDTSAAGGGRAVVLTVVAALSAALLCGAVAMLGHAALPTLMQGDADLKSKYWTAAATMVLVALTLPALAYGRRPSVLDLWLAVSMASWLCQVALESQFNAGRYSLGWYAGRLFGAVASVLLLVVLVVQDSRTHRRLVASLTSERRQQRLVMLAEQRLARSQLAEVEARQSATLAREREREFGRMAKARVDAREAERRRLARDLHDDLGQSLAAIKIRLQALAADCALLDAPIAERLDKVTRTLDAAQVSLRQIVADLRPPLLDELGLVRSLEGMVEDFEESHGVVCRLVVRPAGVALAEPYATAVYRIVQESLTNVARHAGASRVTIELDVRDQAFELCVRDDGRSFDPAAPVRPGAAGLLGMRERIEELGGRFQVDSAPGQGTTITASLPVQPVNGTPA